MVQSLKSRGRNCLVMQLKCVISHEPALEIYDVHDGVRI